MERNRLIFLCILLIAPFTGYSDGDIGRRENSPGKTEELLKRADIIIRNSELISKKNSSKSPKSGALTLKTDSKLKKPASVYGKSDLKSLKPNVKRTFPSVLVMDYGGKTPGNLIRFMLEQNKELDSTYVSRLIRAYVSESRREGVNHDVAVCQMCLETGFLRFDGSVSRYQNNFCGLGAVNAWSDGDWFGSLEEGVRAHIQHLKAYASWDPVKSPLVDKRFNIVQRGTVITIHDLAGKWAADPDYGIKIDNLLKTLYAK